MSQPAFKNRLLSSLDEADLNLLTPHLQPIELVQRNVLYDIGTPFEYLYFIEHGVASVLTMMETGASIEVGMIGYEGMTSVSALLGDDVSSQHVVVQLPGQGFRISVLHGRAAFKKSEGIRLAILRFASSFLNLSAQSAACNRLHAVEQRFARWLLLSSDRFQADILPLTQEYLSTMLGVRRAGVTEAAIELQRAGLIRYTQGQITIVDRAGLERASCECYRIDRERFDRLL